MARRWGKTISIDVDIEEDEVLSQISDETIREEAESRGLTVVSAKSDEAEDWRDFADDLRACIRSGDGLHMEVLIVRMLAMAGVPRLTIKQPEKA